MPKPNRDDWFTDVILEAESVETRPGDFEMPIEKFFDPDFQEFGEQWAWADPTTICQLEFLHGRNRQRCHVHNLWHNFAAGAYNAEKSNVGIRVGKAHAPEFHKIVHGTTSLKS